MTGALNRLPAIGDRFSPLERLQSNIYISNEFIEPLVNHANTVLKSLYIAG